MLLNTIYKIATKTARAVKKNDIYTINDYTFVSAKFGDIHVED